MKIRKITGIIAGVATAFAGLFAPVDAHAANGDIRSIEVYQDSTMTERTYPNVDNPFTTDETLKFRIRLLNRNWGDVVLDNSTAPNYWGLKFSMGSLPEDFIWAAYTPKVGIWVGNKLRGAVIENIIQTDLYFTDLICSYKVQAGDIAFPVKLANQDGTGPASGSTSVGYYLYPNLWSIRDQNGSGANICEFCFGDHNSTGETTLLPKEVTDAYVIDKDLSQAGIYVQTVDFDDNWSDEANGIWRTIAQGSTSAAPGNPSIVVDEGAPSADTVDLYVWTEDESKIVVDGGTVYTDAKGNDHTVGKVILKATSSFADFKLRAIDTATVGDKTKVFLCASPTNIFNLAGDVIVNFLSRTVEVGTPPKPYVALSLTKEIAFPNPDVETEVSALTVSLSESYSSPVDVKIVPSMIDTTATKPWSYYIALSTVSENGYLKEPDADGSVTATIPAGATSVTLYVYGLAGDASSEKGILFTPTIVDQTIANHYNGESVLAKLVVNHYNFDIIKPAVGATFNNVPCNFTYDIEVQIDDVYRAETEVYTVRFYSEATSTSFTDYPITLDGEGKGKFTVTYYKSGTTTSKIEVINSLGITSAAREFTVNVNIPKTISAYILDDTTDTGRRAKPYKLVEDDETVYYIGFDLSEVFSEVEEGYVFLVPTDSNATNLVQCDNFEIGVPIPRNQLSFDGASIVIKDGLKSATALNYNIVIRDKQEWEGGKTLGAFASSIFQIQALNKKPGIKSVRMNGSKAVSVNGDTFRGNAARGMKKTFNIIPNDVEVDIDAGMKAYITFTSDESGYTKEFELDDLTDATDIEYTFNSAGLWEMAIELTDKDGAVSEEFIAFINVLDTPSVVVTTKNGLTTFNENETGINSSVFEVSLSSTAEDPVGVTVDVVGNGAASGLEPTLSTYNLVFRPGEKTKTFFIKSMDGTEATFSDGFTVTATVTNENESAVFGSSYKDAYLPGTFDFYVLNYAPEIILPDPAMTNALPATLGIPFEVKWNIKDITDDLTNNLTIAWRSSEGAEWIKTGNDLKTGVWTNTFTSSGSKKIYLTVTDKDGLSASASWSYEVDATKSVSLYPVRPFRSAQSDMANDYLLQPNIGAGRVASEDGALSTVFSFRQDWNFDVTKPNASIWAKGYKVGDIDNGNLTGMVTDIAIDESGALVKDTTVPDVKYYKYAESEKDSFFYAWVNNVAGENGNYEGTAYLAPQPGYDAANRTFPLPMEATENNSYEKRLIEAIFSKEMYASDNMGDINADEIPDYFAVRTYDGGRLYVLSNTKQSEGSSSSSDSSEGGGAVVTVGGADLSKVSGYNGDEDFFPAVFNQPNPFKPNKDGWLPGEKAIAFSAYYEVRGLGRGLNYRDSDGSLVSDLELTDAEKCALLQDWIYAGNTSSGDADADYAAAAEWAKKNNWTCENRTDPTMVDTDGDGFDDGWEYYFWYYSKIGCIIDGRWQRLEGEKFSLKNVGAGDKIPSEAIQYAFNPTQAHGVGIEYIKLANGETYEVNLNDFDNDGLTDYEEYLLGTNPVHWDSDGDDMSDYWEVLNNINPLVPESSLTEEEANPDGDYMALYTMEPTWTVFKTANNQMFAMTTDFESLVEPLTEEVIDDSVDPAVTNKVPVKKSVFIMDTSAGKYFATEIETFSYAGVTYLAKPAQAWNVINLGSTQKPDYYLGGKTSLAAGTRVISANTTEMLEVPTLKVITNEQKQSYVAFFVFKYGKDAYGNAVYVPTAIDGVTWSEREYNKPEDIVVVSCERNVPITLIHHQVYWTFGFDPRTAWYKNGFGFLGDRWHTENSTGGEEAGVAVNTVPFTSKHEFLLLAYRAKVHDVMTLMGPIYAEIHVDLENENGEELFEVSDWASVFEDCSTLANVPEEIKEDATAPGSTNVITIVREVGTHGADTDSDGVPDGWELYMNMDPNNYVKGGINDAITPDAPYADGDELLPAAEFAGTDSCNAYSNVPSIYRNHPGNTVGWYNKFFPTDIFNPDTDGDRILDDQEGAISWIEGGFAPGTWKGISYVGGMEIISTHTFIYCKQLFGEDAEIDDGTTCIRGGGMNPLSVDTDGDKLPDAWEWEFAGMLVVEDGGTYTSPDNGVINDYLKKPNYMVGYGGKAFLWNGMDATDSGDANKDFDGDGLQNFQEYLVQTLRHLRYDEAETPLMGRMVMWTMEGSYLSNFIDYVPMSAYDDVSFFNRCIAAGFEGYGGYDYYNAGYFALPPKPWDKAGKTKYIFPPQPFGPNGMRLVVDSSVASSLHASTDPRTWDSDFDGMDDYWEIFHGLNPLLGTSANPLSGLSNSTSAGKGNMIRYDRIANITDGQITSWYNAWTDWDESVENHPAYDPIKHPWMMGVAECDADGDGLRNNEEAILANVTSPSTSHTDPSPYWFTDSTSRDNVSYVSQYYQIDPVLQDLADVNYWWEWNTFYVAEGFEGSNSRYMFAFEENEGYDTDNDGIPDNRELTKRVDFASNPLNANDTYHRQAFYFPGVDSAAVSFSGSQQRANRSENFDMLRQFTVETWIKPDAAGLGKEQVVLERVSNCAGSTLENQEAAIRANFRIGINKDNRIYGEFEGSTIDSSSVRVFGPVVVGDEWCHVALTFDGSTLALYINGNETPVDRATGIRMIPANGVNVVLQSLESDLVVSNVIASLSIRGYTTHPCALVLGAKAVTANALEVSKDTKWSDYTSFYQGYIDEVRVWDGARTPQKINEAYKTSFTPEDLKSMRNNIYTLWASGFTRNNNSTTGVLPAELLQQFTFSSLPGATDAGDVLYEPAAFTKNVINNVRQGAKIVDTRVGWWSRINVKSDVYHNEYIVPWIENAVAHLPPMDGSAWDSEYWGNVIAGNVIAAEAGLDKYAFSNEFNPYPYRSYRLERVNHVKKYVSLYNALGDMYETSLNMCLFDLRSEFVGTSDLIPLGGAFAKRSQDMWDGAGAADAWTQTRYDGDDDGLPDWWEQAAYGSTDAVTWDTLVEKDGIKMSASEAYLRDLANGLLPSNNNNKDPAYANVADMNNNGIMDWWEKIYNFTSANALEDTDNDQLCNYVEYLISEGFYTYGFPRVKPTTILTFSDKGQKVPDYFLKVGKLYLGEMFTDHDFVEDWWESLYSVDYASRFAFDASKDADDDGWSNFAEARYSQWTALQTSDLVSRWMSVDDQFKVDCLPMPALAMNIGYFGNRSTEILNKDIIVKVSNGNPKVSEVTYKIAGAESVEESVAQSRYIGPYRKNAKMHFHLNPGSVNPNSVIIQSTTLSTDTTYQWNWNYYDEQGWIHPDVYFGNRDTYIEYALRYPYIELETAAPVWSAIGISVSDSDGHFGKVTYAGANVVAVGTEIGTINYRTGEVELDMVKLAECESDMGRLEASLFRADYSYRISSDWPQKLYLSKPDSGILREGENKITAFVDIDGDGLWTAGEPFGVATPVMTKVGWWNTAVNLELTDTAPQTMRINLVQAALNNTFEAQKALNDRGVNGNRFKPNMPIDVTRVGTQVPGETETAYRVRIVRNDINGITAVGQNSTFAVVYDDVINVKESELFSEANILNKDTLDLGWDSFTQIASKIGMYYSNVTSATYRVVIGDGNVTSNIAATNENNLATMFVNAFEHGDKGAQSKCTPITPSGIVDSGSPTFTWTHENTIGKSYPAFQLRVWAANGTTLVYDSGVRRAPVRNSQGVYSWTAPIYAGMVTADGKVFTTTNNYQWSVSMLDAKFVTPNSSELKRTFRLSASGAMGGESAYGSINVKVKYFGPDVDCNKARTWTTDANMKRLIRVQAFTSPDFSGQPVGEAYVTDDSTLASTTESKVNATIIGVPKDVYYIRAFIDTNGNGECDKWETWGYVNYVGTTDPSIYNPKGVTVVEGSTLVPEVTLYMEDMDSDNDGFPDIFEVNTSGEFVESANAGSMNTVAGNTFYAKVNTNLVTKLESFKLSNMSGSGYSILKLMNTVLTSNGSDSLFAANILGSSAAVTEAKVSIADFTSEAMTLDVETETKFIDGTTSILAVEASPVTVTWKLFYAPSLDGEWSQVDTGSVTVDPDSTASVNTSAIEAAKKSSAYNENAGFFKVVVE